MRHVHHTETAPKKPVKGNGMHHVHYEEIFRERKFKGLNFSNFFISEENDVAVSRPFSLSE